jgi:HSP20 family protein
MTHPNQQVARNEEAQARRIERPSRRTVFSPPVDIVETPEEVLLIADIPGVDEKHVDCTLEAGVLTLRGTTQARVPEGMRLIDGEYIPGDFERVFSLSEEIDQEKIRATVKNGVLHLHLPKATAAKARKIQISSE